MLRPSLCYSISSLFLFFLYESSQRLSLDDLHHRMGHIVLPAAKALVSKGLVTGLALKDI